MRKNRLWLVLIVLATIALLLLTLGTRAYASSGVQWLPAGTVLSEDSFVLSAVDGIDTVKLIESQAAEIGALRGILAEQTAQIDRLLGAYNMLDAARLEERRQWQDKVGTLQAALDRQKGKRWAVGPYGGYGNNGWNIGAGVVFKIIEF